MGTAIVVTSGKGGTGKTSVAGGVACCLARRDKRVLCLDMDVGLRNLDITLGMSDLIMMDFSDVIAGRCDLKNAAIEHPRIDNLYLLTAPLSLNYSQFSASDVKALISEIKLRYDYCIIDCPAGIDSGFELATCGADRAIVVSTAESASLRDAQQTVYRLLRLEIPIHLVINKLSRKLLRKLHTNIDEAMDITSLPLLGVVPQDEQVPICAGKGKPIVLTRRIGASNAYQNIARRLMGEQVPLYRFL